MTEQITIDDFAKVEMKVGLVLESKPVEGADKLRVSHVKIGDEVVIFSDGSDNAPDANILAFFADTINYEIICAVSKRVPRVYTKDGKIVDVMYKL